MNSRIGRASMILLLTHAAGNNELGLLARCDIDLRANRKTNALCYFFKPT